MQGWILYKTKQSDLTLQEDYSVSRMLEEAKNQNIDLSVFTPDRFELIVSKIGTRSMLIDGEIKPLPDFVLPRMGVGTTYFALAVIRQLENLKVLNVNPATSIEIVRDKLHIHQLLAQSDLPTPKTMLIKFPIDIEIVKREIGFPLIIKNITGTEGKGIYLCESVEKFKDIMDLMYSYKKNMNIIIQEYISYRKGEDLRVFIVGDKVVGCMKRSAKDGDFKANFSMGATVESFEPNKEISDLAIRTAKLLGLNIAGIDILFDNNGYKVLEANSSPGFQGMEKATNINIAKYILDYIKEQINV